MSALLQIAGLTAHYGDFQALFGVDLTLDEGQTLAIIGANGAGKTTLMRAITGVARVTAGTVTLAGADITRLPAPDILTRGIAMVPEGRRLFPSLTVEENLLIGAHARTGNGHWTLERVQTLFPILKDRRLSPGTALSGGQQQMVAIGRALMSNPRVLLCDELSALAWPRWSSRRSTPPSRRSRPAAPRSSWSNRTSARPCGSPTTSIA
jgi:branched-chain amino acid transport system ATP-binding protein